MIFLDHYKVDNSSMFYSPTITLKVRFVSTFFFPFPFVSVRRMKYGFLHLDTGMMQKK